MIAMRLRVGAQLGLAARARGEAPIGQTYNARDVVGAQLTQFAPDSFRRPAAPACPDRPAGPAFLAALGVQIVDQSACEAAPAGRPFTLRRGVETPFALGLR